MPRGLLVGCRLAVVLALLAAAAGCGEKKPPANEKVTQANADRITPEKTTITEAEAILGPGAEQTGANVPSGMKGKKWGPGPGGEEIEVVYDPYGKITQVSFVKWQAAK
jgi:predicted small lipoprotein YifL